VGPSVGVLLQGFQKPEDESIVLVLLVTQGYRDRVGEDLVTSRMVVKAC
jgi:hypothetical protein